MSTVLDPHHSQKDADSVSSTPTATVATAAGAGAIASAAFILGFALPGEQGEAEDERC